MLLTACYFLLNVVGSVSQRIYHLRILETCYFLLNVVHFHILSGVGARVTKTCYFLLNVVLWLGHFSHPAGRPCSLLFSFECCFNDHVIGVKFDYDAMELAIFF